MEALKLISRQHTIGTIFSTGYTFNLASGSVKRQCAFHPLPFVPEKNSKQNKKRGTKQEKLERGGV